MAGRKDEFEFDDSLGDFDDFSTWDDNVGFDGEPTKDDRTPVTKVVGGFKEGLADHFKDINTQKRLLSKALPNGYGQAIDLIDSTIGGAKDLYDSAANEIRPQLKDLSRSLQKLIPTGNRFGKKLSEKLGEFAGDSEYTQSREQQENTEISVALGQIFEAQAKDEENRRVEEDLDKHIRERVSQKRFKTTTDQIEAIRIGIDRQVGYQDSITISYQKKSLELQYRQYFTARKMLEEFIKFSEYNQKSSALIVKNTALPDFQKIQLDESAKAMLRDKTLGKLGRFAGNTFNEYTNGTLDRIGQGIKNKVGEVVGGAKAGLEMATMGAEQIESFKEMGMQTDPYSSGGNLAGSLYGSALEEFIANKVKVYLDKNDKVVAGGLYLKNKIDTIGESLNDFAKSDENVDDIGTFKGSLLEFLKEALGTYQRDDILRTQSTLDLDQAAVFNYRTQKAITEIIPGLLSKVHQEVYMLRTGSTTAPEYRFDYKSGLFKTTDQITQSIKEQVFNPEKISRVNEKADAYVNSIDVDKNLKISTKKALRQAIVKLVSEGKLTPSTNLKESELTQYMSPEEAKEVIENIKKSYAEPSNKLLTNATNLEYQKKVSSLVNSYKQLSEEIPDVKEILSKEIESGNLDLLYNAGLVKDDQSKNTIQNFDSIINRYMGSDNSKTVNNTTKVSQKRTNNFGNRISNRNSFANQINPKLESSEQSSGILNGGFNKLESILNKLNTNLTQKENVSQIVNHPDMTKVVSEMTDRLIETINTGSTVEDTRHIKESVDKIVQIMSEGYKPSSDDNTDSTNERKSNRLFGNFWSRVRGGVSELEEPVNRVGVQTKSLIDKIRNRFNTSKQKQSEESVDQQAKENNGPSVKDSSLFGIGAELARRGFKTVGRGASIVKDTLGFGYKTAKPIVETAANVVKSSAIGVKGIIEDRRLDVYVEGDDKPLLLARDIRKGIYKDSVTGKIITGVLDIKNPVIDQDGNVVISQEHIDRGLYSKRLGRLIKSIYRKVDKVRERTFNQFGKVSNFALNTTKALVDTLAVYSDVYVNGETEPRLIANLIRSGKYFLKENGKPITRYQDIVGDIVNENGEVVLSVADIQKGLVDKKGNPIRSVMERVKGHIDKTNELGKLAISKLLATAKGAGNAAKAVIKRIFGVGDESGALISFFSNQSNVTYELRLIRGFLESRFPGGPYEAAGSETNESSLVKSTISKVKDKLSPKSEKDEVEDNESNQSENNQADNKPKLKIDQIKERLTKPISNLKPFLSTSSENKDKPNKEGVGKKTSLFDSDGDGDREGSWQDLAEKKKKAKEAEAAKGKENKESKEKKGKGILGLILGGLGLVAAPILKLLRPIGTVLKVGFKTLAFGFKATTWAVKGIWKTLKWIGKPIIAGLKYLKPIATGIGQVGKFLFGGFRRVLALVGSVLGFFGVSKGAEAATDFASEMVSNTPASNRPANNTVPPNTTSANGTNRPSTPGVPNTPGTPPRPATPGVPNTPNVGPQQPTSTLNRPNTPNAPRPTSALGRLGSGIANLGRAAVGYVGATTGAITTTGGIAGRIATSPTTANAAATVGNAAARTAATGANAVANTARFGVNSVNSVARGVMEAGSKAIRAGRFIAPFVAPLAKGALLAGSLAIKVGGLGLGLLFSPVGLAAAATAAVGYGAYRLFKAVTAKDSQLFQARMAGYGLDFENETKVNKVLALEELLKRNIVINNMEAQLKEGGVTIDQVVDIFKIDKNDQEQMNNLFEWFNKRFKPIYLTFATVMNTMKNKTDFSKVDSDLTNTERADFMVKTTFPFNDNAPYVFGTSPFPNEDLDLSLRQTRNRLNRIKSDLEELAAKEPNKRGEEEGSDDPNQNKSLMDRAKESVSELTERVKRGYNRVTNAVGNAATRGMNALRSAGNSVGNFFNNVGSAIGEGANRVGEAVGAAATAGRQALEQGGLSDAAIAAANAGYRTIRGDGRKNRAILLKQAIDAGITSPTEQAMLLAQVDHESGGFASLSENLRYRADVIMRVSATARRKGRAAAEAAAKAGPAAVAELMYGGRMGNDQPGDGFKYRGRGLIQLTGKDNYRAASRELGVDLVKNPNLLEQPEMAAKSALWFWKKNVRTRVETGDVRAVTRAVNGGYNGLADRQVKYQKYLNQIQSGKLNELMAGLPGPATATPAANVAASTTTGAARAAATQTQPTASRAPVKATTTNSTGILANTSSTTRSTATIAPTFAPSVVPVKATTTGAARAAATQTQPTASVVPVSMPTQIPAAPTPMVAEPTSTMADRAVVIDNAMERTSQNITSVQRNIESQRSVESMSEVVNLMKQSVQTQGEMRQELMVIRKFLIENRRQPTESRTQPAPAPAPSTTRPARPTMVNAPKTPAIGVGA